MRALLACRSQAIFRASVLAESLPVVDVGWLDTFVVPGGRAGEVTLNSYLGRGPLSHDLGASAVLFFEHGEESYPAFGTPSIGPSNAGLFADRVERRLDLAASESVFVVNVTTAREVQIERWEDAGRQPTEEAMARIQGVLAETAAVLGGIVGGYALYQYALVWQRVAERHSCAFIDPEQGRATRSIEPMQPDNFIPVRLDASSHIRENGFIDPLHAKAVELLRAGIAEPLTLLKDSLWADDLRARFLMQFWIVESLSERRAGELAIDAEARQFVSAVERAIAVQCPDYLSRFRSRKGDLLRRTLAEKVAHACQVLRVRFDEPWFKRARRVRDTLSHGSGFNYDELREMERYIRELCRLLLRRELEFAGVFLEGAAVPVEALPLLTVRFEESAADTVRSAS